MPMSKSLTAVVLRLTFGIGLNLSRRKDTGSSHFCEMVLHGRPKTEMGWLLAQKYRIPEHAALSSSPLFVVEFSRNYNADHSFRGDIGE
ncbi:hypothetical protein H5410_042920 [Solanum commersonii]|uniref:Uncharacterized protein n=1 Tax=Solanum commersonii TaxID=4109 RepID=A0A9J5XZZ2_SOLCO|nr:hypothetical protein H5410_042920 [Solanum commersonii]